MRGLFAALRMTTLGREGVVAVVEGGKSSIHGVEVLL